MNEKLFTTIKDEEGNEHVVPASHRNMRDVQLAIARAKIKAYGLTDTPEEYIRKSQERSESSGRV